MSRRAGALLIVVLTLLSGCGDPRPSPDQHGDLTISQWTLPMSGGNVTVRRARAAAERFCGPGKLVLLKRTSVDDLEGHATITFRCGR